AKAGLPSQGAVQVLQAQVDALVAFHQGVVRRGQGHRPGGVVAAAWAEADCLCAEGCVVCSARGCPAQQIDHIRGKGNTSGEGGRPTSPVGCGQGDGDTLRPSLLSQGRGCLDGQDGCVV